MLIAMFILSIQFCFDEYFMRKYSCHPLICIGYQGVFGFFINLFLCLIFYFIKCGSYEKGEKPPYFVENMCTGDDKNVWRPENIVFALRPLSIQTKKQQTFIYQFEEYINPLKIIYPGFEYKTENNTFNLIYFTI
jgi:hypothetical protein